MLLFLKRYWRGEVSLPISYWLVSWGANITAVTVIAAVHAYVSSRPTFDPKVIFGAYCFLIAVITTILVWQFVGLLRSSRNYINTPNKVKTWGYLAALGAVAGIITNLSSYKDDIAPVFTELYRMAILSDPDIPPYKVTVGENGRELKIQGGIKYGLLQAVRKALARAPSVKTIDLESMGGRIGVAEDLYNYLSPLHLNTVTNGACLSACTYVFAAGKNRWLGLGGRLGFHSASFANLSQAQANEDTEPLEMTIHTEKGVPLGFFRKASKVPAKRMWYPDRRELLENHYITASVSKAISSLKAIERILRPEIAEISKTLPKKIDKYTTLVEIHVKLNRVTSSFTLAEPIEGILAKSPSRLEYLRKIVGRNACGNPKTRSAIRAGIVYRYVYLSSIDRSEITSFEVGSCR